MQEAQQLSDAWLVTYSEHRPHDALGRIQPLTYLPRVTPAPASNYLCVVHLTGKRTPQTHNVFDDGHTLIMKSPDDLPWKNR